MTRKSHRRRGDTRTTTQRGYGSDHQQRRAALLPAALGTTCPARFTTNCDRLMTKRARMHLDHSTPLALGGTIGDRIICAPCNLTAGARLAHHLRRAQPARPRSRNWHTT